MMMSRYTIRDSNSVETKTHFTYIYTEALFQSEMKPAHLHCNPNQVQVTNITS